MEENKNYNHETETENEESNSLLKVIVPVGAGIMTGLGIGYAIGKKGAKKAAETGSKGLSKFKEWRLDRENKKLKKQTAKVNKLMGIDPEKDLPAASKDVKSETSDK